MAETDRDRILRQELEAKHLREDFASLDARLTKLVDKVEELSNTVSLLSATITALRRVLWLVAGAVISEVAALVVAFVLKGGLAS